MPDLLDAVRSGDMVGVAASKDQGILYKMA